MTNYCPTKIPVIIMHAKWDGVKGVGIFIGA